MRPVKDRAFESKAHRRRRGCWKSSTEQPGGLPSIEVLLRNGWAISIRPLSQRFCMVGRDGGGYDSLSFGTVGVGSWKERYRWYGEEWRLKGGNKWRLSGRP